MVCATSRNNEAVRLIEELGLSLHVESRDGEQQLVACDRRNRRRYTARIRDGREDAAADRLLAAIQARSN